SSILCFSCYLFFTSVTSTLYFTFFFFNDTATTEIYTLSLHDALPIYWGTDLVAGARFKYGLLWVVGLASLMAIFMQIIAARLGVVTGKDLAQCCRDWYPKWTRWPNWLMSEIAIGACDLAEVLGSAVALNLL